MTSSNIDTSFPFKKIIEQQISLKKYFIKDIKPPYGGICIVIKNNKIFKIINGSGWVHPRRKEQYVELISNCLKVHTINDCNININLQDHPMPGVFNFCRIKGSPFFLLPNHRFTNDDIKINGNNFDNYDQQKKYILNYQNTSKINKIYNLSIPHKEKIPYFKYALENLDICHGYAYTGSCHKLVNLDISTNSKLELQNMAGTDSKDWIEHLNYKYLIYSDGNTLSDRMRLLLCSKSVIIRQNSRYEEFYSYLLLNNFNYIQISNIDELRNLYDNLEKNPNMFNEIVDRNTLFVENVLTYENILYYCKLLINGLTE